MESTNLQRSKNHRFYAELFSCIFLCLTIFISQDVHYLLNTHVQEIPLHIGVSAQLNSPKILRLLDMKRIV